jgi:hypothetical protein
MFWIKLCCVFLLAAMRCAAAEDQCSNAPCDEGCGWGICSYEEGWSGQLRAAAFHPTSSKFRKVYSQWEADYQMEMGKRLITDWSAFFNLSWVCKRGHLLGRNSRTRINVAPVSLGIKASYYTSSDWNLYSGVGATYTFLHIFDNSRFARKHTQKRSFGFITKLGAQHTLYNGIFFDFFADYLYLPFHFSDIRKFKHHSVDVGGWKVGMGVGREF